jgi:hypothetical protein
MHFSFKNNNIHPAASPEFLVIDVFLEGDVFLMRVDWNDAYKTS